MKYLPTVVTCVLFLAGCQVVPPSQIPAEQVNSYKALGTEPFWSLKVENDAIRFKTIDNSEIVSRPFTLRRNNDGLIYRSGQIQAVVTPVVCSDGMSDNRYQDTVIVTVNGETYQGCGGAILEPVN